MEVTLSFDNGPEPAVTPRVLDHGGRFRQDFPPACVPIRRGEVVGALEAYVTA